MEKITKAEAMKELQRLRSMERHEMTFRYKDYHFRYQEDELGCRVHVTKCYSDTTNNGTPVGTTLVKPFGRETFETWCICWTVDNKEVTSDIH